MIPKIPYWKGTKRATKLIILLKKLSYIERLKQLQLPTLKYRRPTSCSQCCRPNRLQHLQEQSTSKSVPVKQSSLAGRRWPGLVHGLCPGVQMSAQIGAWIPVITLPTHVQYSWSLKPPLGWSWWAGFPTHVSICPRTGVKRSLTPALQLGTHSLRSQKH